MHAKEIKIPVLLVEGKTSEERKYSKLTLRTIEPPSLEGDFGNCTTFMVKVNGLADWPGIH